MQNKFANEIEEIAHLALGPNATVEQISDDLRAIAERMRESGPTPRALDTAATQSVEMSCPHCGLIIDVEIHQTPRQ